MRNNPFVLLALLIVSVISFYGESINPTKVALEIERPLVLNALVSKLSFNAHDFDESARSLTLKSDFKESLKCSFSGGSFYTDCKAGERISWSSNAYNEGFKFIVKDDHGNKRSFSPKTYNPFLSFHKCDVLFKKGASEASFRRTLSSIQDLNNDDMKVVCLEEGVELKVTNGPFIIEDDLAIIGTHARTAKIIGLNERGVFENEENSLFLYNLNIETSRDDSTAITLGVGSYLGVDNLKIKTASAHSKGINCFGCTIDGEGLEVLISSLHSEALKSSLGLIELRRSTLQGGIALLSKMGSNINLIDETMLLSHLLIKDN